MHWIFIPQSVSYSLFQLMVFAVIESDFIVRIQGSDP